MKSSVASEILETNGNTNVVAPHTKPSASIKTTQPGNVAANVASEILETNGNTNVVAPHNKPSASIKTTQPGNVAAHTKTSASKNLTETSASRPSSLVIVIGSIRSSEVAWKTLYDMVLDPNGADLALFVGELSENATDTIKNSSLFDRANYTWFFPEYDDWAEAIDLINGTSWRETYLPQFEADWRREKGLFGGIKGFRGSGTLLLMVRWLLKEKLIEANILEKYERFVITRSDHYYTCPQIFKDLDLKDDTMWTPNGEDYGGVNDRYLVVSKDNIIDALDTYAQMLSLPFQEWSFTNIEKALNVMWQKAGLKVAKFDRVMFTTAISTDLTRWSPINTRFKVHGVDGLFYKYKSEYSQTVKNCSDIGVPKK